MKRELTCIVCPRGCSLVVELGEAGEILSVVGNACKRGITYATDECTNPMRTVTTTMRCEDGGVVACKTASGVPKSKMFDVMESIRVCVAPNCVSVGDVLIKDVCGTGVDVVATAVKNLA